MGPPTQKKRFGIYKRIGLTPSYFQERMRLRRLMKNTQRDRQPLGFVWGT
jgi:hypothetical protein